MIYDKDKIILLHPPKTGGSTLENFFEKMYNISKKEKKRLENSNNYHKRHSILYLIDLNIDISNYYKIITVRNPYDLLWSYYNHNLNFNRPKFHNNRINNNDIIFSQKYSLKGKPNFILFVKWILEKYNIWKQLKKYYIQNNNFDLLKFNIFICNYKEKKYNNEIDNLLLSYNKFWLKPHYIYGLDKNDKFIKEKFNFTSNLENKTVNNNYKRNILDTTNSLLVDNIKIKKIIRDIFELDFIHFNFSI